MRPRSPAVPSTPLVCPTHGLVEGRVHRIGFDRQGMQRFRVRCPDCHARRNKERYS